MKDKIHPKSKDVTITCTCGAVIKTASTLGQDFNIELCSKCHPFFTGKQRLVDSTGRVERFHKRYAKHQGKKKGAETKPKSAGKE
jgi:large subunit ribosomal protein L31